jgi:hypothetical protein
MESETWSLRYAEYFSTASKTQYQGLSNTIRAFRMAVEDALPPAYKPIEKMPRRFDMLLKSLQLEEKYLMYMMASQYTHGAWHATRLYQENLGGSKKYGEFIKPEEWSIPLVLAWYALHSAGQRFLICIGGDPRQFLSQKFGDLVQAAVNRIAQEPKS